MLDGALIEDSVASSQKSKTFDEFLAKKIVVDSERELQKCGRMRKV